MLFSLHFFTIGVNEKLYLLYVSGRVEAKCPE